MKSKVSRRTFITTAAVSMVSRLVAGAKPSSKKLLSLFDQPLSAQNDPWKNAGVLDLSHSRFAKLQSVPVRAVAIKDGFWSKRQKTNVDSSIPSMREELLEHGRMDNFLRLEGESTAPQRGPLYSDSDVYKWLEASAFVLQNGDRPELRKTTESMIRTIVSAQEPGGYLNTYFVESRKSARMLYETQVGGHELYCIGHLLQAAIANYRATGDRTLLDAGMRFVDHFLLPGYGPGKDQKGIVAGHPEIEMALIELYRTTGKREYVDLAGYILHGDERIPLRPQQVTYMFCGVPFTSRTRLEGHAVRAMYACCGATDYFLETGDPNYWKALNLLWEDLAEHQLYVTGGVGAREAGEAFGDAYELPNARAYGESCAAIGNMMWNWRMLAASGESRFTDVIERALYNGINSGMSLDGKTYCYRNPLAFDASGEATDPHAAEDKIRNPWYDTTCCPPNLERTFASLSGYFYSTSAEGVYVHLYDNSEMNWHLQDGTALRIEQRTNYPWSGDVHVTITPATASEFTLFTRIPAWSEQTSVTVNGKHLSGVRAGEYLAIHRRWAAGDTVQLGFDMTTRLIKANPAVTEDRGRVAFQRGPLVFCMEEPDQMERAHRANFADYIVQVDATTEANFDADLLQGVMVLSHPGTIINASSSNGLYYSAGEIQKAAKTATTLRLIPYYAWANRGPAAMQVWIPYSEG